VRDNKFLQRLKQEIPTWVERGWVQPDQQHAILDHVSSQAGGGGRYLTLAFALMGVLLLGTGVITFFAANWRELSKLAKLVILFGAMWLAYGGSVYFRGHAPKLAEALVLLGVILFGANIHLIAQIYHIDAHYPNGVLMWAIGALLAAYLLDSQPAMVAALLLGLLWSGMESWDFDRRIHWPFLILWLACLPWIFRQQWRIAWHVALAVLLFWCATVFFRSFEMARHSVYAAQILLLLFVSLFILGLLFATSKLLRAFAGITGRYSAIGAMFALFALTFPYLHTHRYWGNDRSRGFVGAARGMASRKKFRSASIVRLGRWGNRFDYRVDTRQCIRDQHQRRRHRDIVQLGILRRLGLVGICGHTFERPLSRQSRLRVLRAGGAGALLRYLLDADESLVLLHGRRIVAADRRLRAGTRAAQTHRANFRRDAILNRTVKLLLLIVLQSAALITMVGMKQHTLNTGIPVLLETEPIDPRSLFSGDYVILNYKISSLDLNKLGNDKREFKSNETVYVSLKPGKPYWEPVGVAHEISSTAPGNVVLKGTVDWVSDSFWNPATQKEEKGKFLRAYYGIENYFVPEGEGREIERRVLDGVDQKIDVRVAVDMKGNAGIQAILVNGETRYEEKLF
jgi:uncharacterized membrane-anchored protein